MYRVPRALGSIYGAMAISVDSMAQNEEWQAWGKKYLQTNLRERAKSAERQMQWFSLQYGLKFSDFPHAEE
jgi:hypothetical protein